MSGIEPFELAGFSTCQPVGCLVPLAFGDDVVSDLSAGDTLRLQAQADDTGQTVTLPLSLSGFGSAYARVNELSADTAD